MVETLASQLTELRKQYTKPTGEHVSLGLALRAVLFVVPLLFQVM